MEIPIIDIFAGPGGLGEGFSAYVDRRNQKRQFEIALSIEKDAYAHQTLTIRSFYHQFAVGQVPLEYYEFVKGRISLDKLFENWPKQAEKAINEAWQAELGDGEKAISNEVVDERIAKSLDGKRNWLLIGGPPCQAYSVVGRSRRREEILIKKMSE